MTEYNTSGVDGVTFQKRVTVLNHYVTEAFKAQNLPNGNNLIFYQDVQGDKDTTLFIKTTKNTQIDISFTYDTNSDPDQCDWFTYCNSAGTAITLTCNNTNKAIPITMKGVQMRVIITNTDSSAGTITTGLD